MHAHDASRRTAPVRMCTLRMRVGHVEQMSEISQTRTTTVESNMKNEYKCHFSLSSIARLGIWYVFFCAHT